MEYGKGLLGRLGGLLGSSVGLGCSSRAKNGKKRHRLRQCASHTFPQEDRNFKSSELASASYNPQTFASACARANSAAFAAATWQYRWQGLITMCSHACRMTDFRHHKWHPFQSWASWFGPIDAFGPSQSRKHRECCSSE